LELERIITKRHRSGSLRLEDALNLFDELLPQARPASVHAFNRVLTVVARVDFSSSLQLHHSAALAVTLFNTMARVGVNKMAANACTIGILIRCFCTVGRLDLAFAAFGQLLKTGWRVQVMALNQLIKGLCDGKTTSEAMDIVLRRIPKLGCTPNVFSYTILIKGLCDSKRTRDAMDIVLRRMPELGCTPNDLMFSPTTLSSRGSATRGRVKRLSSCCFT
jgi:pentatricopeptide repeat protein